LENLQFLRLRSLRCIKSRVGRGSAPDPLAAGFQGVAAQQEKRKEGMMEMGKR